MKTILLMRHAKAALGTPGQDDRARPLAKRGREAAPAMGRFMVKAGLRPDLILCSTAQRTVETLDLVLPFLDGKPRVRFEDTLYLAEPDALYERLQWIEPDVQAAMLIGHNPGMHQLAMALARAPKSAAETKLNDAMSEKFSTAALAVLQSPARSWDDIRGRSCKLVQFVRPRDL